MDSYSETIRRTDLRLFRVVSWPFYTAASFVLALLLAAAFLAPRQLQNVAGLLGLFVFLFAFLAFILGIVAARAASFVPREISINGKTLSIETPTSRDEFELGPLTWWIGATAEDSDIGLFITRRPAIVVQVTATRRVSFLLGDEIQRVLRSSNATCRLMMPMSSRFRLAAIGAVLGGLLESALGMLLCSTMGQVAAAGIFGLVTGAGNGLLLSWDRHEYRVRGGAVAAMCGMACFIIVSSRILRMTQLDAAFLACLLIPAVLGGLFAVYRVEIH